MKFQTYQIADVSTKHITQEDGGLLGGSNFPIIGHVTEGRGTFMVTPLSADRPAEELAALRRDGYSEAFVAIIAELHRQRIPYVRFDCDGAEIEGAPVFEW